MGGLLRRQHHTGCKCLAFTFGADQQEPEAFVYDTMSCASSAAQIYLAGTTSKMLREHAKFMFSIQHSVSLACSYL